MTKVEALKELYVKLGGNASDVASVDNIAEMIEKVKNIAENGGELPDGGSNGQVLTKSSNGAVWADVPTELPSGGTQGQILTKGENAPVWGDAPRLYQHYITLSADEDETNVLITLFNSKSTSLTFSEICSLINGKIKFFPQTNRLKAGSYKYGDVYYEPDDAYYPVYDILALADNPKIEFLCDNNGTVYTADYYSSDITITDVVMAL